MKNYICGYGSLIEQESRTRTTPQAVAAFPVKVKGYVRGWWARTGGVGFSTTYLGCVASNAHSGFSADYLNGVIYEVSESELVATDQREQGYTRTLISNSAIEDYLGVLGAGDKVWIYLNKFPNNTIPTDVLPSPDFPIVQSYVDICVNGCLELETLYPVAKQKNFAVEFIKSTQIWSKHWANDRLYPRRPFIYCPNASTIDGLLSSNLTDKSIFKSIYIE